MPNATIRLILLLPRSGIREHIERLSRWNTPMASLVQSNWRELLSRSPSPLSQDIRVLLEQQL